MKESRRSMLENSYSVHFTKVATNDLDNIYCYISKELLFESEAMEILNRIESSIMQLEGIQMDLINLFHRAVAEKEHLFCQLGEIDVFFCLWRQKQG